MVAAVSSSSARPAENSARIADSACVDIEKRRDCASEAISAADLRTRRGRQASNNRRSKFDDTWMSIDGDVVAATSRTS